MKDVLLEGITFAVMVICFYSMIALAYIVI